MTQTPTIYLSRRNLLALLSKLDRVKAGESSLCTIQKCDPLHPKYPQTMAAINVVAVEDEDYYTDRLPGVIHEKDIPARV
jgi:hypothetical protein